jgi:DNA-directed RNA polymerase subunit RPC12/RpoP
MKLFKKKQKKEYVRICPNCGSLNIEILNVQKQFTFAFGMPALYKCNNCGFSNNIFPEVDVKELEKLNEKDKLNKRDKNEKRSAKY